MAAEILSNEFLIQVSGKTLARTDTFSLNANGSPIEITSFDSQGWKEFLMGVKDWGVEASGIITRNSGTTLSGFTGYDFLMAAYKAGTLLPIKIMTTVSGDKYESGNGYITKIAPSYSKNEKTTYSISFQGTGALTTMTL